METTLALTEQPNGMPNVCWEHIKTLHLPRAALFISGFWQVWYGEEGTLRVRCLSDDGKTLADRRSQI